MDIENNSEVQSTPESSPAVESAPAASPAQTSAPATEAKPAAAENQTADGGKMDAAPAAAAAPQAAPYVSNYKFVAYGKENDVPELFRSLIKDEKSDKEVKQFLSKAYAFEPLASKKQEIERSYKDLSARVERPLAFLEKKDYESFFKSTNIPDEAILEAALNRLKYREMDPQQRAQYDAQNAERERLYELEMQNQQYQQQYMQMAVQTRSVELDSKLNSAEIKELVQNFDSAYGKPGSFRNAVIDRAAYIHATTGEDISVEDAIERVKQEYLPFLAKAQQAQPSVGTTPAAKPPVIPNLGSGHHSSPARKIIKSSDDLRKVYQEKFGN